MPLTANEILEEARQLPVHMQRWLAQELLDPEEDEDPEAVEAAWDEEIKRRLDEIDSGAVQMIPGEVVLERMYARIEAARNRTKPRAQTRRTVSVADQTLVR